MNIYQHTRPNEQNELVIDPERNIAVNARNMTGEQDMRYYRSFFMSYRPDLTEPEYVSFLRRLQLGESFLNQMHGFLMNEVRRINYLYPIASRLDKVHQYADQFYQLRTPFILGARSQTDRNWVDASKVVNYLEDSISKSVKYGLNYPTEYVPDNAAESVLKEDEIFDRFTREMRKPPQN